ncbi:MAG: hypothetical protein AAGD06_28545 [Acidobacteriota bacterium]
MTCTFRHPFVPKPLTRYRLLTLIRRGTNQGLRLLGYPAEGGEPVELEPHQVPTPLAEELARVATLLQERTPNNDP